MEDKNRKIQRKDVLEFLKDFDASKPIVPVILDDSGLPEQEGSKYVRALFSNPKKMGMRCVVSNKCERFLKLVYADKELMKKVEFVNIYLADDICNTAGEKKECTIYIMPDYSRGEQMRVSFFRVVKKYVSNKKARLLEVIRKWKKLLALLFAVPALGLLRILYDFIAFLGEIENLKELEDIIGFLWEKLDTMNVGLQIVLAVCVIVIASCIVIQDAIKNADKVCAQAVGNQGNNFVFFLPFKKAVDKDTFVRRWLDRNGFYRIVETETGKKKQFFYYCDCKKNLSAEDDVSPVNLAKPGDKAQDGYRFLFAVLEHFSSLKQEIKLQYHPNTLVRSENDIEL